MNILEKLSLCLNPRVCELLTCPSSCDGSRQSDGCVDVRESASPMKEPQQMKGKKRKEKKIGREFRD